MRRKPRWLWCLCLLSLIVAVSGCGGDDESSAEAPAATEEAEESASLEGKELKIGFVSTGLDDLGVQVAIKKMEEQGVKVTKTDFAEQEQSVPAMVRGTIDVVNHLAATAAAAAINEGAEIQMIAGYTKNRWVMVTNPEITDLQGLEGKRIGVHSDASFTKAVASYYLKEAGVEGKLMIVPGSEVRAQALAKGQLDATVISLEDVITLGEQFPGKFKELAYFAKDYPDIVDLGTVAGKQWIEKEPELAKAWVAALSEGYAEIQDIAAAQAVAEEHYSDFAPTPEILEEQIKQLVEGGFYPADAGLTPEQCKSTIAFTIEAGQVEGDAANVDDSKYCTYELVG
jgi:ABC-type nitrate/sulfonate/bicarbonate transport system substrate-binding protein